MHWLDKDKQKKQLADTAALGELSDAEQLADPERQRQQARSKMVLYCLNDRMRIFGPMMVRVMKEIESEQGLVVLYPKNVTYGGGDPYFPTYEWQILPKQDSTAAPHDPRKLTLALRASPGDNLSEIMVYYLLTYVDGRGDEYAIHRLPTDFRNERMIKTLLLDGIKSAGLDAPGDPTT